MEACRNALISAGMNREVINRMVGRIRAVFRWAVGRQTVPPETLTALEALRAAVRGRTAARESEPVRAVPEADLEATMPHLSPVVRAMVEVQI